MNFAREDNSESDDKLASWKSGSLRGAGAVPGATPRVLFGVVYEDAEVELAVWRARLDELKDQTRPPRAFCVASGGDTLFSLLLPQRGEVVGVDVNPAQVALCALKVAARHSLDAAQWTRATRGDARPFYPLLRPQLDAQTRTFWDANLSTLAHGLSGCGLVDGVLRRASFGLRWLIGRRAPRAMLAAPNVEAQRRIWRERANRCRFRALFALFLNPLVLRAFYGRALREGLPLDLGERVRDNLERALLDFPVASNPYVIQLLRGHLSPDSAQWPIALRPDSLAPMRAHLDDLSLHVAEAAEFLEAQPAVSFDFFALSNVIEAVGAQSGTRLMRAVERAAAPGALVCVRSITGALPPHSPLLESDERQNVWREGDRSPFCRLQNVLRRKNL